MTDTKFLKPGDRVPSNGALVLAVRKYGDKENEAHLQYLLCQTRGDPNCEWVTWAYNAQDGGAFWGHYFNDFVLAVEDFRDRPGKKKEEAQPEAWAVLIHHRNGLNLRAGRSAAECNRKLEAYVRENWRALGRGDLDPAQWKTDAEYRDRCVETYFEAMSEEEYYEGPELLDLLEAE
jgi:hypothetical protein